MNKINLINMGTEEEATILYNNFISATKKNNRKCKIWMFAVLLVGIATILLLEWLLEPGIIRNVVQIAIAGATYIVLNGCFAALEPTTPYFHPPTYIYHNILKNYGVPEDKIVWLDYDFANPKNELKKYNLV